jgi:hypothetical protein
MDKYMQQIRKFSSTKTKPQRERKPEQNSEEWRLELVIKSPPISDPNIVCTYE